MGTRCLIVGLVALLALSLSTSAIGQSPEVGRDFGELERTVAAELRERNAPGAAVAVVSGDRVVFAKGFGVANVVRNAPVTPDTLFQIGSITKTFTATAVLTLAEEGKLRLDAPVGT